MYLCTILFLLCEYPFSRIKLCQKHLILLTEWSRRRSKSKCCGEHVGYPWIPKVTCRIAPALGYIDVYRAGRC